MSEKIKFPDAIIDEMVFWVPDSAKLTISVNNANGIDVYDPNKTELIILYRSQSASDITPAGKEAIEKMINAVKLDRKVVSVINLANHLEFNFRSLAAGVKLNTILGLGITPDQLRLHIEFTMYKILVYNNINLLFCDDIDIMEKQMKTLLWNRLQTIFNLK
ncbi:MAG: hypothetical protein ACHQFW_06530 [Chitinophagales bacterium]